MKTHWANSEKQAPLCNTKMYSDLWWHTGAPQDVDCRKCKTKMCENCFGTGIMNGKQTGIYCSCKYGTIRELQVQWKVV